MAYRAPGLLSLWVGGFAGLLVLLTLTLTLQQYRSQHSTRLAAEMRVAEVGASSVVEAMSLAMAGGNTVVPRDPASIEEFRSSERLLGFRASGTSLAGAPYDMRYDRALARTVRMEWPEGHGADLAGRITRAETVRMQSPSPKLERLLEILRRKQSAYLADRRDAVRVQHLASACAGASPGAPDVDLSEGVAHLVLPADAHGAKGTVCLRFDVSHLSSLPRELAAAVLPPALFALVVTIMAALLLSWLLLAPLRALAHFADTHALDTVPRTAPGLERHDALGVLARVVFTVFGQVAQQLKSLEDRQKELEAALDVRASFLATMSHEIRTPLNGVLGLTDLALDGPLDESKRELLQVARSSGELLLCILNDILDLSKLEAGEMHLETRPVCLRNLLDETAALLASTARERRVDILVELHPEVPSWVVGDPVRLRQIALNLASNAVKFTEDGQVILRWGPTPEGVELKVVDTGIGIADTQIIFERFRQEDASTTRRFGGTGLGLAICHALTDKMGGEIGVDSQPGEGSTFWVRLPLPATTSTGGPPATSMEPQRILLAEDDPISQRIARSMLERMGHSVVTVSDGAQALAKATDQVFDLILLDWHMPHLDGVETTSALRALGGRHASVPIVALSAGEAALVEPPFLAAGADMVLGKPIRAGALMRALAGLQHANTDEVLVSL